MAQAIQFHLNLFTLFFDLTIFFQHCCEKFQTDAVVSFFHNTDVLFFFLFLPFLFTFTPNRVPVLKMPPVHYSPYLESSTGNAERWGWGVWRGEGGVEA